MWSSLKSRLALCGLACLCSAAAEAATCPSYPNTLTNGTTADATQVMGNLTSILTCANTSLAPIAAPQFTGVVTVNNSSPSTGAQLSVTPTGYSWNEGIEVNPSTANGYSILALRSTANSITGGWEISNADSSDATGPHSLDLSLNGLTGMTGTGRPDTPFSINTSGVTRFGASVGIENPAPSDVLDVAAPVVFGGTAGERLSLNSGSIGFNRQVATGNIYTTANYAYQFQHNGNSAPASDVLTLQIYRPNGSNVTGSAILFNANAQVSINGNPNSTWIFTTNGQAGGNTGWATFSDARLKQHVTPIVDALSLIQQLRGERYHFRAAADREVGKMLSLPATRESQVGFVA